MSTQARWQREQKCESQCETNNSKDYKNCYFTVGVDEKFIVIIYLLRKGETVTDDGSGHQLYLQHELLPVHWPILTVFCEFSLVTTVMSKREIAIKNHNSITA